MCVWRAHSCEGAKVTRGAGGGACGVLNFHTVSEGLMGGAARGPPMSESRS